MELIIKELYLKKNKIKEQLELLEEELVSLKKEQNNKLVHVENKSSFQEIYKEIYDKQYRRDARKGLSEKYLKALELYKQGLSVFQIAREMNMGVRETEMIFKIYGEEDLDVIRNKFFSIIFNNLVFGLGILLIITGIYFLSQPEAEPE